MTRSRCSQDDVLCGGAVLSRRHGVATASLRENSSRRLWHQALAGCIISSSKPIKLPQWGWRRRRWRRWLPPIPTWNFPRGCFRRSSSARWRNIRGSGVGHVPPSRAGSLRQIFTNNNRHPLTLVTTTKKRGATVARTPQWGWVEANGGIDSPFVSLSSSDLILSFALRLAFRYAIYPEFALQLEPVAALLLRWTAFDAAQRSHGMRLRKRLDFWHLTVWTVQ